MTDNTSKIGNTSNTSTYSGTFKSPFGDLIAVVDETGVLVRLILPNGHQRWANEIAQRSFRAIDDPKCCTPIFDQLDEYFQRRRETFDIPLRPEGTAFQRSVWAALQTIPYGETITYKALAERIGNPAAIRAVGRANGSNPLPIVIPCHRVIGADGSLIGFGGGLLLKEQLLDLEGVHVDALSAVTHGQLSLM